MTTVPERIPEPLNLPPEIFQHILQYLPFRELVHSRRVSRRWRTMVDDCPAFRGRFRVRFPQNITMDESYVPPPMVPAATVSFHCSRIVDIDGWWQPVARRITDLRIWSCDLPLDTLAYTTNLKCLFLNRVQFVGTTVDSVSLGMLKTLEISDVNANILRDFNAVTPVLEEFIYRTACTDPNDIDHPREVVQFIEGRLNKLKRLLLLMSEPLDDLSRLGDLKLERVYIHSSAKCWDNSPLIQFLRAQRTVETLSLVGAPVSDSMLCEIGKVLPNLKKISFELLPNSSITSSFLRTMPILEYLKITNLHSTNFKIFESHNLRKLKLIDATVEENRLEQSLQCMPFLRELKLKNCNFESWSQLYAIVSTPQQLEFLKLECPHWPERNAVAVKKVTDSLKKLEITISAISGRELKMLFRLFPGVTVIRLYDVNHVTPSAAQVLCQTLTKLKRLALEDCRIFGESIRYIRGNRPEVRLEIRE